MDLRLFKKRKNNVKNIPIYILTFIISSSIAQREIKVISEDFDGDGLEEELIIHNYLGQVDYAVITYEQGTKQCTLKVSPKIAIPTLINTVPLCDDLSIPKYNTLVENINKHIFNTPVIKSTDPTLGWLIDVYSNKKILKNNNYFFSCASFKPEIQQTDYRAPLPHRLLVNRELANPINRSHQKTDTTKKSWILFDANKLTEARQITKQNLNPYWPQLVDSIGSINIFKTGHSVFIETDTTHQIVFVSEGVLYDNIQKINWESIQEVGQYRNYIFVLTHPYPAIENKLFMIDTKKGMIMEFKKNVILDYENDLHFIQSFKIIEDELFLFLKGTPEEKEVQEKSIPLILIRESIKALDKTVELK